MAHTFPLKWKFLCYSLVVQMVFAFYQNSLEPTDVQQEHIREWTKAVAWLWQSCRARTLSAVLVTCHSCTGQLSAAGHPEYGCDGGHFWCSHMGILWCVCPGVGVVG